MKKYLVSYKYKKGDGWGFGDRVIPKDVSLFDRKLDEDDLDSIKRFLGDKHGVDVVISNIIPLPI